MSQNGHKQLSGLGNVAQWLFQVAARMAQLAYGGGVDTFDFTVAYHQVEHAHDGFGLADKQRFVAQIDQIATQLKIIVQRARLLRGVQCQDRFIEQL
ncbi:hypothetical protein D3C79_605920 [compost metagenome]